MSPQPAFSVVIPAFNEADTIADTIRSLQAQTRDDWEAVVVDDGSSDGTALLVRGLAEEDPRIRLIRQANAGLPAARNAGIAEARASLVSFLDADDLWLPGYLDAMGVALEAAPWAAVAYTKAWVLDTPSGRFRRKTAMEGWEPAGQVPRDQAEAMKLLIRQNFIWVCATVRRAALEEVGGFREELDCTEDIDLWLRILALGHRIVGPVGVLGIKGERPEAMSRADLKNVISLQGVLRRLDQTERLAPDVREAIAAKIESLERWRLALSGEGRMLALGLRARLLLGKVKRATVGRRDWLEQPPPEVQAAFPELGRG